MKASKAPSLDHTQWQWYYWSMCEVTATSSDDYIDGLAQEYSNSSALAMELLHSFPKPSTYRWTMKNI